MEFKKFPNPMYGTEEAFEPYEEWRVDTAEKLQKLLKDCPIPTFPHMNLNDYPPELLRCIKQFNGLLESLK